MDLASFPAKRVDLDMGFVRLCALCCEFPRQPRPQSMRIIALLTIVLKMTSEEIITGISGSIYHCRFRRKVVSGRMMGA